MFWGTFVLANPGNHLKTPLVISISNNKARTDIVTAFIFILKFIIGITNDNFNNEKKSC